MCGFCQGSWGTAAIFTDGPKTTTMLSTERPENHRLSDSARNAHIVLQSHCEPGTDHFWAEYSSAEERNPPTGITCGSGSACNPRQSYSNLRYGCRQMQKYGTGILALRVCARWSSAQLNLLIAICGPRAAAAILYTRGGVVTGCSAPSFKTGNGTAPLQDTPMIFFALQIQKISVTLTFRK
jgi:hypothetical protein